MGKVRLFLSRRTLVSYLRFSIGLISLSFPAIIAAETLAVDRLDGSSINVFVERPEHATEVPIVLFIDGSGCQSAKREGFQDFSSLPESIANSIAKVFVDKRGVNPSDEAGKCTQEFLNYYTIDQRILDHLRVIQNLRTHARWWNREIYLVGWSDGGSIGVGVASYTPEVKRAVFLGTGGGIPMAEQFEDYILCARDRTDTRETCIENLADVFDDIRANPSPQKSWMGEMNTYNAWASRLDMVEFNLIKDLRIPLLIVHGENDRDSVPIQSARELIRRLDEVGSVDYEYWEIPGAGHNIGIYTVGQSEAVRVAIMNWLFEKTPGPGGPPHFGRPSIE